MSYRNFIVSLLLVSSILKGQEKLCRKYISLGSSTGCLILNHSNHFKLIETNKSRIYFGTWIKNHDTLILNYQSYKVKAYIFNKRKKEIHTELVFIKSPFIKDNRIYPEKLFIAKKEFKPKPSGDNARL